MINQPKSPQQGRVRRRGCNEDCLYRIATRLCELESSEQRRAQCDLGLSSRNDDCSKPAAKEKNGCADDDCCKPAVEEKDGCADDDCCKPAAKEKAGCVDDDCCKPAVKEKAGCADDGCCKPTTNDQGCKSAVKENDDCCKPNSKDDCCKPAVKENDDCCKPNSKDDCCKPAVKEKDDSCKPSSKDDCCKPEVKEKDDCCKPAVKEKDNCCKSTTNDQGGNHTLKEKDGCADDDCCKPVTKDQGCNPTLKVNEGCADDSGADDDCSDDDCCKPAKKDQESYGYETIDCVNSCCDVNSQAVRSERSPVCSKHLQVAFARFESLLRQGHCLCRRVMSQMNFCCCSGDSASCKSHTDDLPNTVGSKPECKAESFSTTAKATSAKSQVKTATFGVTAIQSSSKDAESTAAREHVVLNVTGMTCTGCSKKLANVLNGIPGIHDPKVTFVSGTAAFEMETGAGLMGVEQALPVIEKQTGFKLSRVISGYQNLDVLIQPSMAQQIERDSPDGFISVEKISGKQRYCITYNPTIVGVRDLLPPSVELAPPVADPSLTEGKKRLVSMGLSFVLSAIFTIPIVVLSWSSNPVPRQTREIVSLVLATVVQAIAVPEFYVGAVKSLVFSRVIEMDMLVVISITAAYFYSVVAFALHEAGITVKEAAFFETSSLLITLVLLGRLVAAFARVRAVSAVSLRSLQAETTRLMQADGQAIELDARLLQFGDTIQIPPHSRIVTDGDIVSGTSAVDESMLTGEGNPVSKQIGDNVIAGTVNGPGVLVVRLTRLPGANSITDIANLVENALGAKPRIQDLADKVASWFIPSVVAIAVLTLVIWIVIALKVRGENAGGAIGTAITYGIAVLAISCPCALGLAVPMVLVIAGGVAARAGVVIKEADAIERGYKTTDVVFDKTGTLTKGDLAVAHESTSPMYDITKEEMLALTSTLVNGNNHPVSLAINSHLGEHDRLQTTPEDVNSVPGAGIEARWSSFVVKAGNPYWTATDTQPSVREIIEAGMTAFCVTLDGFLILAFGLTSTIRDEAASVIEALQRKNIRCHVVSGDTDETVQNVASRVGIDTDNVASRQSPAQKMEYVKRLQSTGRVVLFCGDGTNDAVAVAQANVGVQIGIASDVTNGVCDVTLLGGLDGILTLLGISKRAFARITFNFVWTAVYNVFAILIASGAFVKVRIAPAYAGLGEIVSVLPVIVAAVTLVWGKNSI